MTPAESQEVLRVWEQVKHWPLRLQISLARRILDSVDTAEPPVQDSGTETHRKRGRPVEELIGLGAGSGPPPSDEQVRHWIGEHRIERHGQ